MKRFGMTLRLKPGKADIYKAYHAAVWPEVLDKIKECNIRNYSIFFKADILFSYFQITGMTCKPIGRKWPLIARRRNGGRSWNPYRILSPTRKEGEWWAGMEEVFHVD